MVSLLNFSSCLKGVPLEVFKKLGYCSWFSRIVLCLGNVDPMMLTHIQVLVGQGLCRL